MRVRLEKNGLLKEAKVGFSWTTLFFGCLTPLFRGDIKWALIMFVVAMLTFGISHLVFPFIYNKIYIKDLISAGYTPASETDRILLVSKQIIKG